MLQASVPNTCEVIPNRKGTAPIMVFRFPESRFGHKASLYALPGVPFEALGALEDILEEQQIVASGVAEKYDNLRKENDKRSLC